MYRRFSFMYKAVNYSIDALISTNGFFVFGLRVNFIAVLRAMLSCWSINCCNGVCSVTL